jgi:hypothetical protein
VSKFKRRGSSRGVEVKKRSSCLSTLSVHNEELLEKTIEEIFHTDSYSGWYALLTSPPRACMERAASSAAGLAVTPVH